MPVGVNWPDAGVVELGRSSGRLPRRRRRGRGRQRSATAMVYVGAHRAGRAELAGRPHGNRWPRHDRRLVRRSRARDLPTRLVADRCSRLAVGLSLGTRRRRSRSQRWVAELSLDTPRWARAGAGRRASAAEAVAAIGDQKRRLTASTTVAARPSSESAARGAPEANAWRLDLAFVTNASSAAAIRGTLSTVLGLLRGVFAKDDGEGQIVLADSGAFEPLSHPGRGGLGAGFRPLVRALWNRLRHSPTRRHSPIPHRRGACARRCRRGRRAVAGWPAPRAPRPRRAQAARRRLCVRIFRLAGGGLSIEPFPWQRARRAGSPKSRAPPDGS